MNRFLQIFLYPFALCYGVIVHVRNLCFNFHILPSARFPMPVICVGNLTVGGTGKTPHIEYLIRLLQERHQVATLSRGYGRKTKGFLVGTKGSGAAQIGDEPLQFLEKFGKITVAVDEKRSRGIRTIMEQHKNAGVILLDDAYQHRYVKAGLTILLTDYHKLYPDDYMFPTGTLREFRSGATRADIIVVTKTPKIFSPITRRRILEDLHAGSNQSVYFSYIKYGTLYPVFNEAESILPLKITSILLFTGIASDYPLREHLERMCSDLVVINFPDHHDYNSRDIDTIINRFNDLPTQKKILVTTEKDVMRMKNREISNSFKKLPLFCIPIEIDFHGSDKEQFDDTILKYVREDKRDGRIS